jgi:uncharacterized protein (DUF2336 family)
MRRLAAEEKAEQARETPLRTKPSTPKTKVSEAVKRARALKAKGELGEPQLLNALASDRNFARAALAVLGDVPIEVVDRVLSAHSAKGVTALVWRAGLSMRAAVKVQVLLGQIPPPQALKPRNGDAYPMSEEAMLWQLDFFGVPTLVEPVQG